MQKRLEHGLLVLTMIVTKAVFVQVVLKIFRTDMMINAPDTVFDVAPETVDGLSMNVADDVDFCGMQNPLMGVTFALQFVIDRVLVSVDCCPLLNGFSDDRQNRLTSDIWNRYGLDTALSFNDSEHRDLVFGTATALTTALLAAKIRLICFYIALKRIAAVFSGRIFPKEVGSQQRRVYERRAESRDSRVFYT